MSSKDVDLSATFGGLGPRLRAARLERGLSQESVAKPWFTKSYISAVERNKVRPSLKALELIARRLEIPIHELLTAPSPAEGEVDLEAMEEDLNYQLDHANYLIDSSQAQEALQLINGVATDAGERLTEFSTYVQYRLSYLRGRAYQRLREPQQSRSELNEAMRLAQKLEDGAEEIERVRNLIGGTYYDQDMPRRALEQHEQAMQAVRSNVVKNLNLRLAIYTNLANDYWALGDLNQAIGIYRESLELVKDTNNLERQSAIYWGLSTTYQAAGDFNRAKLYGAQALTILEAANNLSAATLMRMNLAQISISRAEYEEAAQLLTQAAAETSSNDPLSRSVLDENFATLELRRGRIDEAEGYARESLRLGAQAYERGGTLDMQAQAHAARTYARSLRTAALVAEARGRKEEADQMLQQALEVLSDTGYGETIGEIEFDYAELLAARGSHQDAAARYRAAYQQRLRVG